MLLGGDDLIRYAAIIREIDKWEKFKRYLEEIFPYKTEEIAQLIEIELRLRDRIMEKIERKKMLEKAKEKEEEKIILIEETPVFREVEEKVLRMKDGEKKSILLSILHRSTVPILLFLKEKMKDEDDFSSATSSLIKKVEEMKKGFESNPPAPLRIKYQLMKEEGKKEKARDFAFLQALLSFLKKLTLRKAKEVMKILEPQKLRKEIISSSKRGKKVTLAKELPTKSVEKKKSLERPRK